MSEAYLAFIPFLPPAPSKAVAKGSPMRECVNHLTLDADGIPSLTQPGYGSDPKLVPATRLEMGHSENTREAKESWSPRAWRHRGPDARPAPQPRMLLGKLAEHHLPEHVWVPALALEPRARGAWGIIHRHHLQRDFP